jgi:RNA polymerase sigma factor (sigma-70 family)
MPSDSDAQLLRAYAERGAETAFAELVQRHTNLVYSAAMRQVESPAIAAEITQSVFVSLAHGAKTLVPRLAPEASLAGWLCRCAYNLSRNHRRDEFRRSTRERLAMEQMNAAAPDATLDWEKLRRVLDNAMADLNEADYDALVLRFYQNQDFRAVGAAIGVSDDTAQKRVTRALDKLRDLLARRGIRTTAGALGIALTANAVQAAPIGLAITISAAAIAGTAVTTSTLITATTKTIAMTTLQKTLVAATVAGLAGFSIYEAHQATQLNDQVQSLQQQQAPLLEELRQLQTNFTNATNQLAALRGVPTNSNLGPDKLEILKLRAESTRLRQQLADFQSNTNQSADPFTQSVLALTKRAAELNQTLEQMPDKKIPELQLLTENDWLNAAKAANFDSEATVRKSLAYLRAQAKQRLVFGDALALYVAEHDGQLPNDISELKPWFKSRLNDHGVAISDSLLATVFSRYDLLHTGNVKDYHSDTWFIAEKSSVDTDFDSRAQFGINRSTIMETGTRRTSNP